MCVGVSVWWVGVVSALQAEAPLVWYRKPIATDTTIHFTSTHPNEHKLAAHRYYIERMLNLPLKAEHQKRE